MADPAAAAQRTGRTVREGCASPLLKLSVAFF
jgi:hypothetical protein